MDIPNSSSHSTHVVGIYGEDVSNVTGNNTCGVTTCELSNFGTISKDATERSLSMRKLTIAIVLCMIFMTVEVVGGIKANSLSIMTDAAHLLSDVAAFAISLFSLWASQWGATTRQSYGFFRIEILGALVSIQLIWLLAGILVYEAIMRLIYDSGEVQGFWMFAIAAFGLVVNIIMAILLGHDHGHVGHNHHDNGDSAHDHDHDHVPHHDSHTADGVEHVHKDPLPRHSGESKAEPLVRRSEVVPTKEHRNVNVQSAYLHVLGDSVQSLGVMVGGAIIWYKPEWRIIDLICTLIFSVIVLVTTINMLRNILEVLMESTPREIDAARLENGLYSVDGVVAIHELHIWAITVGKVLLACHVTIMPEVDAQLVMNKVIGYIKREYNINHLTIQIERM